MQILVTSFAVKFIRESESLLSIVILQDLQALIKWPLGSDPPDTQWTLQYLRGKVKKEIKVSMLVNVCQLRGPQLGIP